MKLTDKQIAEYLDDRGFKHSNLGFGYIISAVKLLAEDRHKYLGAIVRELYPAISKEHKTTPSRAERAIRHAIDSCNCRDTRKLRNGEFLARTTDSFLYEED